MDEEPAFHPMFRCTCEVPHPRIHLGEDTGLCGACDLIYDQQLYAMRLRQHVPRQLYDPVREYLATGVRA